MEINDAIFWTLLLLLYGGSVYLVAYHHGWTDGHRSGYRFGEQRGRRFKDSRSLYD